MVLLVPVVPVVPTVLVVPVDPEVLAVLLLMVLLALVALADLILGIQLQEVHHLNNLCISQPTVLLVVSCLINTTSTLNRIISYIS